MREKPKIGIVGIGMVGDPVRKWFDLQGHKRLVNLFCFDADDRKLCGDDFNQADIIFVCVPTNPNPDGSCDVSIVESVVRQIKDGKLIVIKSTVVPGTTEKLQAEYPNKRFLFNPEFLTEAQAWEDYIRPQRQLIGFTEKSRADSIEVLRLLPQACFERPHWPDYGKGEILTATDAEIVKYFSNVFGALKVGISNVFADICFAARTVHGHDVDYERVRKAVAADSRVGLAWTNVNHGSYSGFGGYCFPKDLDATINYTERLYQALTEAHYICPLELAAFDAGLNLLKSLKKYNEALISAQGLTMNDVSRHDKQVITKNHRPIRQPPIKKK